MRDNFKAVRKVDTGMSTTVSKSADSSTTRNDSFNISNVTTPKQRQQLPSNSEGEDAYEVKDNMQHEPLYSLSKRKVEMRCGDNDDSSMGLNIVPVRPEEIQTFLKQDTVIFDIRSYNLYLTSRIKSANNSFIPVTLLRRKSFRLSQLLELTTMSKEQKQKILDRLQTKDHEEDQEPLRILIYDAESTLKNISQQLSLMCSKFTEAGGSSDIFKVHYVDGGFAGIPSTQDVIDASSQSKNHSAQDAQKTLSGFYLPLSASKSKRDSTYSNLSCHRANCAKLKLDLSAKSLKENNIFKPFTLYNTNANYTYNFKLPEGLKRKQDQLPKWLKFFVDKSPLGDVNYNKEIAGYLAKLFNDVEKSEQLRLNIAMSRGTVEPAHNPNMCSPSSLCPGCDSTIYRIPKGVEYGLKNRFHNIWPYEHSRVKVQELCHSKERSEDSEMKQVAQGGNTGDDYDDYFNASYVHFSEISKREYIATQYPLRNTFEDFWKIILNDSINVIICLDDKSSRNQTSDVRYFDDCLYDSGIAIKNENEICKEFFNVRTISITEGDVSKTIYHLEFKGWPDFGVPTEFGPLLEFIQYKDTLVKEKNLKEKFLVHCLAGCGRTGCFISIDMILDCFHYPHLSKLSPWGDRDLVYKSVQRERTQRIAMVQNLDQFIFCYNFILSYVVDYLLK